MHVLMKGFVDFYALNQKKNLLGNYVSPLLPMCVHIRKTKKKKTPKIEFYVTETAENGL